MSDDLIDRRLRALEVGQDLLTQQHAELVVTLRDLDTRIATALVTATRELITDPETLAAVGKVAADLLASRAQQEAGGWLWRLVKRLAGDWIVRLVFLYLALKFLGFDAAVAAWGLMKGKP